VSQPTPTGPGGYTGGVPNPLNPAQVAGALAGGVKTVTGLIPGADAANAILDATTAARRWMGDRHNWVRVGWVVAGFALVAIGASILVRKPIGQAGAAVNANVATAVKAVA
jgi:hypothetical protein